ncbi:nuclear transcription factor Y subunit gamma-like [Calliphora vicina]|uniref:nuclear transcription factor Y subunit gamma-like n=1 Tax=Calliphora vicina TaxID=7373 RepID=UPI00325AE094
MQQRRRQLLPQRLLRTLIQTYNCNITTNNNNNSNSYNYNSNSYKHQLHQQQQQQQIGNSSSTSASTSLTTTPLSSNASNLMPSTPSLPIGHLTNTTNAIAPATSIQLSTNLTFATSPPIEQTAKTNHENIYGQTRNLNFKQNNSPPVPPHSSSHHNQAHFKSGHQNHHQHHQHHRHHSHHSHQHQHQHRRSHHHGSYGCLMHSSHPSARSTPGEFRFKTHEPLYDDFDSRHSKHFRPSRRSSSTTAQIDNNCNCVSCYTLAPLFGAPTPKRPPRSLSQQQLRQHQRLSGAKNLYKNELKRGVVKWCSDSDVSLLGREDQEQSEGTDDYRAYANRKACYDDSYNYDDFNLDQDFDIENFTLTQLDYKKQMQKPNNQKFNGYAARHNKYPSANDSQPHPLTDGYVDKARLRQIRSPTPKRKESLQSKEGKSKNPLYKPSSNLLAMRNKSQSTESFFEQPHDEGTIYMYGGRKRIVKAPSATNIYDRIKSQGDLTHKQAQKYNSQMNLHYEQRKPFSKLADRNDHDTLKPLVPPPLWRGAKRMNLKGLVSAKLNNFQALDHNNNNVSTTRQDAKINNLQRSEETNKTAMNPSNGGLTNNGSNNGNKTTIHTTHNHHFNADSKHKQNDNETAQQQQHHHHQQQQHQQNMEQLQQQQQPQFRIGRSSSRVDLSDMESIYGYLKPRKPRSLSMKKIQILDY